jgi:hypothetical protein
LKTAHISLVTSLYRTEQHLSQFVNHAASVAEQTAALGLTLEFIPVVNDASPYERQLVEDFARRVPHVHPVFVPRETLYASWNRGVKLTSGQVVGFWNVDDVRTVAALVDGYQRIQQGCELVYFSYTVIRPKSFFYRERVYPAVPFDAEVHRRKMKCSPFFLFNPSLYEKAGDFDERFRIVGDWEWCVRALNHADFCPSPVNSGQFFLHGGNLSDTGNPLQTVEENILFILHGMWESITPADPELMRETWAKWHPHPLPPEIEEQLWGIGAQARWKQWKRETARKRRRVQLEQMARFLPKKLIDTVGLRPYLARLGLIKARK